jgi:hypothetical protein
MTEIGVLTANLKGGSRPGVGQAIDRAFDITRRGEDLQRHQQRQAPTFVIGKALLSYDTPTWGVALNLKNVTKSAATSPPTAPAGTAPEIAIEGHLASPIDAPAFPRGKIASAIMSAKLLVAGEGFEPPTRGL